MHPQPQVHLRDGGHAKTPGDVNEHANFNAVAVGERHRLEHVATGGALSGEGLDDAGQMGKQTCQQGPSEEFVHSSALSYVSIEGAAVEALDEADAGVE